jgi:hypothetical protein
MVHSSEEALIQALLLRDHLCVSNLNLVTGAVIPRLDAAVASALVTIGIEPVLLHPSFSPQVLDALLHVCAVEKRQAMLPEILRLLKSCSSDVMQGRTSKLKPLYFEALLRLSMCVSHGYGCSTLSAFGMILRFIVPLLSKKLPSDVGRTINQIIVPRCFMNSQNVAVFLRLLRSFLQVGCRAHISRQIHQPRPELFRRWCCSAGRRRLGRHTRKRRLFCAHFA